MNISGEKAVESLRCSEINFANAVLLQPVLKMNPVFLLAVAQLHAALSYYDPEYVPACKTDGRLSELARKEE